jgi:uncharacterized membrane protein
MDSDEEQDLRREREAADSMNAIMQRNIRTVLEKRRAANAKRPLQVRMADRITRFTGSMQFVYLHLLLFAGWIIVNLPATPFPKFDPTFVVLAMFASVEAIFLSTFVLISQNRMAEQADRRADLDLQVSLLAEHEVTRLITMVKHIAERLDLDVARHPDLHELEQDVAPEKVLDALAENQRRIKPDA